MTDDLETCSWCTAEVPDATLTEEDDGARICLDCFDEAEIQRAEASRCTTN